jgi:phospholipase C
LADTWGLGGGQHQESGDSFDLWVLGPNGFLRHFRGTVSLAAAAPKVTIRQHGERQALEIRLVNDRDVASQATFAKDAYDPAKASQLAVPPKSEVRTLWHTARSHDWYDFSVTLAGITLRAAGRIERGQPGISDPLMAMSA